MTYMPFLAEMPNGEIHRGMRRIVIGNGIAAKMTSGTLELTGIAAPVPEVSASFTYRTEFGVSDLINGVLIVEHGLEEDCPMVQIWDSVGEVVQPDKIRRVGANSTAIDLSSFGNIEGNWEAVLIK